MPDKQMSVSLSMGQVNDFCSNDQSQPELLRAIMTLDAQLWSDLLWLSGGLLDLTKCSFHHIHFEFAADGTAFMKSGSFGPPLQIHDNMSDSLVTIPEKSAYTPHKTLGHHKAPAGSNLTQLQILRANSDVYAKLVSTSPCTRTESWYFYNAIYLKAVGYVLPNCFFTRKALRKVQ